MSDPTDTQPTVASGPGGSIYDLGLPGLSRPPAWPGRGVVRALFWQTLRACYGIGRGARAKIVPFTLAGLALIPAIVAVGIAALIAQAGPAGSRLESFSPIQYYTYASVIAVFVMLFCAAQAPELFGRDQRYRRAAAVLLAGAGEDGLRRGADRRAGRRAAADGARAAAAAVRRVAC